MERAALDEFMQRVRKLRSRAELDAAAGELLDAFEQASVRSLLLKGPALARLLYTADRNRGYSDVDLLVGPRHLAAARRALSDLGYTNVTAEQGVEDIAGSVHADLWVRRNQKVGPLMVDLHSRLTGIQVAPQRAWEALEARRTWIDVGGRRAAVLDPGGLALHLATHAAQHGPDDLKAQGDLSYGLEHWSAEVWREAARLAHEVRATEAFAAGLRFVPAGAVLADELGLPAADRLRWEILNRDARPRGTFHMQALLEARSPRELVTVLRRSLLPRRAWIVSRYPWAAKGRVRPLLARALHLLSAPAWALRAWRFRRRAHAWRR